MLAAIESAKKSVSLSSYIFDNDRPENNSPPRWAAPSRAGWPCVS